LRVDNPTQYQIWRELKYDPFTGIFTRRTTGKRACRTDHTKGYLRVFVLGKYYKAHRLAWFYRHAIWPTNQIDHINGNKQDNSILNLRDVVQTINMYNQTTAHSHNKSGLIGVGITGSKFIAKIKVKDKLVHLGTYNTKEEAHHVYLQRKAEIVNRLDTGT
jgi:hypothetical protein